jgi:hypothetical protein
MANQIEREIGEADVDLEYRPVPTPFADALPQHQSIVAEAQQIIESHWVACGERGRIERAFARRTWGRVEGRQRSQNQLRAP